MWWLRNFFRKRMNPIAPEFATKKKYQLSLMYSFFAWNSFAFFLFYLVKEKFPKENTSLEYAKFLGVKDATVISFKGFKKVDQSAIQLEDSEIYGLKEYNQEKNEENLVV